MRICLYEKALIALFIASLLALLGCVLYVNVAEARMQLVDSQVGTIVPVQLQVWSDEADDYVDEPHNAEIVALGAIYPMTGAWSAESASHLYSQMTRITVDSSLQTQFILCIDWMNNAIPEASYSWQAVTFRIDDSKPATPYLYTLAQVQEIWDTQYINGIHYFDVTKLQPPLSEDDDMTTEQFSSIMGQMSSNTAKVQSAVQAASHSNDVAIYCVVGFVAVVIVAATWKG